MIVLEMPPKKVTRDQIFSDKNFKDRISKTLEKKECCDVTFLFDGGKQKVAAHKVFLVASSPVFSEMFNNPDSRISEVEMDDSNIDVANFEVFIQNLSTGKVKLNMTNVEQQTYLARKYKVASVEELCMDFLKTNIKPSNVFDMLQIADYYDMEELRGSCIETLVDKFTGEVEDVKLFSKLPLEHLLSVIEDLQYTSDSVQINRLMRAFTAWLLEQSNGVQPKKRNASEMEVPLNLLKSGCKSKLDK